MSVQNVQMSEKSGRLTIVVDLSKDFGPSKSGKTVIVASTGGFVTAHGVSVGLNVVRKP